MTNINKQVETNVAEEINKGGFSGSYKVRVMKEKPHISGSILLDGLNQIDIRYNPAYEDIAEGRLPVMARDVTRHEVNHRGYRGFNGCPRTLDFHVEKIYEPIAEVLQQKGFGRNDAHYVANALEDTILHTDLGGKFALDGISELFSDVGRNLRDEQFTAFYDAHVKLNMFLWGNGRQKKQVGKYFTHDKEKQAKIRGVMKDFLDKSGLRGMGRDRQKLRDFLNDDNNWQRIARVYAEEFSQLMEPSYAQPIINHSGRGTKGREGETPSETDGNEFDRQMEREEYKMKRVGKAFRAGSKIPPMMDSFEALDLVYQGLARQLKLKVKSYSEQEQRPVFWYGSREFDEGKDDDKHVTFGFDENGNITLKKRRYSEKMDIPHKISPQGFPETRFCLLDTSGSMKLSPDNSDDAGNKNFASWGDNSKYHFGLLGWYGLLEYLKQNHLLSQTTIGLGNFSTQTRIARGLEAAKRNALQPQFGSTKIDSEKIRDIFAGNGSLVYTISDGEIENWRDIKEEFMRQARNHYYFHMQIGAESEVARELRKKGFNVFEVHGTQDLADKVIEVTDNAYRRTR